MPYRPSRRTLLAAGMASALGAGGLRRAEPAARNARQDPATTLTGSAETDGLGRFTVPVTIDGSGPFAFIVDCAAEGSVIRSDVVERLALPTAGRLRLHTVAGAEVVPAVRCRRLSAGALEGADVRLAVVPPSGLEGADGLLGADLLRGQRIVFRFAAPASVAVEAPHRPLILPFSRRRRLRFEAHTGRLRGDLAAVRVRVGRTSAVGILDTGATRTVINAALAEAARAEPLDPALLSVRELVSATGAVIAVTPWRLPGLGFGGIAIPPLTVVAADLHTFDVLGLSDRPSLLMGMDVLSRFRSVSIDPERGELVLER